jgi:hypothetical protein
MKIDMAFIVVGIMLIIYFAPVIFMEVDLKLVSPTRRYSSRFRIGRLLIVLYLVVFFIVNGFLRTSIQ